MDFSELLHCSSSKYISVVVDTFSDGPEAFLCHTSWATEVVRVTVQRNKSPVWNTIRAVIREQTPFHCQNTTRSIPVLTDRMGTSCPMEASVQWKARKNESDSQVANS